MIDIHCHILPEIDDGSTCLEESLDMAQIAVQSGVTDIIATPHFRGEQESLEQKDRFLRRYEKLKTALAHEGSPLKLHLGAEILCLPETVELAKNRQLPTLAGTDYVLTEFFFDESFEFMDRMLEQIAACGYRIVVAHPERYDAVQFQPDRLEKWARQGYVLQVNKGSILGNLGRGAEQTAGALMEMGLVHLFASDAHSCRQRTPHMGQIARWAQTYCMPEYAHILLHENPRRVLRGKDMAQ